MTNETMNIFTRYKIDLGPRAFSVENTLVRVNGVLDVETRKLLLSLLYNAYDFETEEYTFDDDVTSLDELELQSPTIVNVTPGQTFDFYGIILKAPSDAAKMIKWTNDSINAALVSFIKSDNTAAGDSFLYQICNDNWMELEVPTGSGSGSGSGSGDWYTPIT